MKKLLFLIVLTGFALIANSQYYYLPHLNFPGNPGKLNADAEYPDGGGLPTGWTVIKAGTNSTPQWSSIATIPFNFNFAGSTVSKYKVSTSGVLTFQTSAITPPVALSTALPSNSIPDSSICVWGLAAPGSNDEIITKTFGTAPHRQHWISFSSYNIDGGGTNCWVYFSIVLEETTNKIYIVDQRLTTVSGCQPSLTIGIQLNSTTANQVAGSPTIQSTAGSSETDADNNYYEFIYGIQPAYDMSVTSNTVYKFLVLSQAPFNITGQIFNFGTATVNSFDLNYSINNVDTVTANISSLNIAKFANYNFTHPTPWTPSTAGIYNIKVWATNINGNKDQDTTNDVFQKSVEVLDTFIQRKPLHEVFTSSTCPPCNPGNAQLQTILDANPNKYTVVKYQMNFPGTGDPYYTEECATRSTFYGGISSIPRLEVDGQWDGNPNSYTTTLYNKYYSIPSFVSVASTYSISEHMVYVNATINPVKNFPTTNLKAFIAIVEKKTTSNVKTNGETEFHFVMKKMVPDANGISIGALTKNTPVNLNKSFTFPGNYKLPADGTQPINLSTENSVEEFTDLTVVVWVQDITTKEVLQSAFSDCIAMSLPENSQSYNYNIYPNPLQGTAKISFTLKESVKVNFEMYNSLGQNVLSTPVINFSAGENTITIPTGDLKPGVYITILKIGDKQITRKVVK